MSFNLPDTIVLPASPERHNIAVAEIVIFGAVLPIQLGVRYFQIRRYADAKVAKKPLRCCLRAWLNFLVIFALIRIVGFALYIGVKNPSKAVVIAEVILQSIGLSPLLLELSFTLLRCGRVPSADEQTASFPKFLKRLLQYTRVPVVIAAVLIIVAGSILNLSYLKAGVVVLMATFIYLVCIAILAASRYRERLAMNAQIGLWIAIASLPLYTVRVVYLMLVEFGNVKFDPVIGDWRYFVVLGFAMEVGIVILLILAGVIVEPFWVRREFAESMPTARSGKSAEINLEGVPSVH